jgi:hypothetical protein
MMSLTSENLEFSDEISYFVHIDIQNTAQSNSIAESEISAPVLAL